jgi:hypothetical protein
MATPEQRARRRAQRQLAQRIRSGNPPELGARQAYLRAQARQGFSGAGPQPNLRQMVSRHAYRIFGDTFNAVYMYSIMQAVNFNINRMTRTQLQMSLEFDLTDWRSWASIQSPGNVWWYHTMSDDYRNEWRGESWDHEGV